jgi:hypothetical protein
MKHLKIMIFHLRTLAFPNISIAFLKHPSLAQTAILFNPLIIKGVNNHNTPLNDISAL